MNKNFSIILQLGHGDVTIIASAIIQDKELLATLDEQGTLIFWDFRAGKELDRVMLKEIDVSELCCFSESPNELLYAYGPAGRRFYRIKIGNRYTPSQNIELVNLEDTLRAFLRKNKLTTIKTEDHTKGKGWKGKGDSQEDKEPKNNHRQSIDWAFRKAFDYRKMASVSKDRAPFSSHGKYFLFLSSNIETETNLFYQCIFLFRLGSKSNEIKEFLLHNMESVGERSAIVDSNSEEREKRIYNIIRNFSYNEETNRLAVICEQRFIQLAKSGFETKDGLMFSEYAVRPSERKWAVTSLLLKPIEASQSAEGSGLGWTEQIPSGNLLLTDDQLIHKKLKSEKFDERYWRLDTKTAGHALCMEIRPYHTTVERKDAIVKDLKTGEIRKLAPDFSPIKKAFDPKSGHISFHADNKLQIFNISTNGAYLIPSGSGQRPLAISGDGELMVTFGSGQFFLWDLNEESCLRSFLANLIRKGEASSSGPNALNIQLSQRELYRFKADHEKGIIIKALHQSDWPFYKALSSPDDKIIAVIYTDQPDKVHLIQDGQTRTLHPKEGLHIRHLVFSPDGRYLALALAGAPDEVFVYDLKGERGPTYWKRPTFLGMYLSDIGQVSSLAFHPQSNDLAVAYGDRRVKIYKWKNWEPSIWKRAPSCDSFKIFRPLPSDSPLKITFSREGSHLVLSNSLIEVFEYSGDQYIPLFSMSAHLKAIHLNFGIFRLNLARRYPRANKNTSTAVLMFNGHFNSWLQEHFSVSASSPAVLNVQNLEGEHLTFVALEAKDKKEIQTWSLDALKRMYANHGNSSEAITEQPTAIIDVSNISYDSFYVAHFPPILYLQGQEGRELLMYNWHTGQQLGTFYLVNERLYLLIGIKGQYLSTSEGHEFITFQQDGEVYPAEQFDLLFNQPHRVLETMGVFSEELIQLYTEAFNSRLDKIYENNPARQDIIKQIKAFSIDENTSIESLNLPEVWIANKENIPGFTNERRFTFEVGAKGATGNLERLSIYVNGVPANCTIDGRPITGKSGFNLSTYDTNEFKAAVSLLLSRGENKIQASVLNQWGLESIKEAIYINFRPVEEGLANYSSNTSNQTSFKPDLYIAAIGVNQYQDDPDEHNLKYAVTDAKKIIETFRKMEGSTYRKVHEKVFLDQKAIWADTPTKGQQQSETIKEEIKTLLSNCQVDDRVIIFFAGHGLVKYGVEKVPDLYLMAHNTIFSAPEENGIPYTELESLLDGIEARNKLILLDACHSGQIDAASLKQQKEAQTRRARRRNVGTITMTRGDKEELEERDAFTLMKELFFDLRFGAGISVMAASAGSEKARESGEWGKEGHGVFTHFLLQGLYQLKTEKQQVAISELEAYVLEQVTKETGHQQRPEMRSENISNDWILL